MAKGKKKWISGAIQHPGALHEQLGIPEGKKIPASVLEEAAKKPGKLGKRARLAQTLKGMRSGNTSYVPTGGVIPGTETSQVVETIITSGKGKVPDGF